jgi:V/A-type H+/Na+-transporting ATPase subunit E
MSVRELVESLRKAGDEKVCALWREAEDEAGAIRTEIEDRIGRMRADSGRVLAARVDALLTAAIGEAKNRARFSRLNAERTLSERLFSAASSALRRLRDDRYPALFEKLALELPSLDWQVVQVNPGDVGFAKKYFPKAEIVPDDKITGGMDATAEGGAIRVINTFEKRLERSWLDLLPDLIKDVYKEVSRGAPSAT